MEARRWLAVRVSVATVSGVRLRVVVVVRSGRVMMVAGASSSSSRRGVGRVVIVRRRGRRVGVRVRWRRGVGCHVNDRVAMCERGGRGMASDHAGRPVVRDAAAAAVT